MPIMAKYIRYTHIGSTFQPC